MFIVLRAAHNALTNHCVRRVLFEKDACLFGFEHATAFSGAFVHWSADDSFGAEDSDNRATENDILRCEGRRFGVCCRCHIPPNLEQKPGEYQVHHV